MLALLRGQLGRPAAAVLLESRGQAQRVELVVEELELRATAPGKDLADAVRDRLTEPDRQVDEEGEESEVCQVFDAAKGNVGYF